MISLKGLSWARFLSPAATPWLKRKSTIRTRTIYIFFVFAVFVTSQDGYTAI